MIRDSFLQSVVQINCIPVMIIIFLLYFIRVNFTYEKELSKKFLPSVALLVALIIVDNLDYYAFDNMSNTGAEDTFHRAAAMLGYDIRIILMSSLIGIAANRLTDNRKLAFMTVVPALLNTIILLPCLFTDIFFFYTDEGNIGRGPLAFEPHILSGLYMLFLFVLAYICKKKHRTGEMEILLLCGVLTMLGFLAEFLFALRGILIGVVALDITFYYVYLHIEHFRFDSLTEIMNRDAFYSDVEKYGNEMITHVLSIDLNYLKVLNDTYGHNAGDKALRTTAKSLEKACTPGCFVYRIGGDEFAALFLGKTTPEAEKIIADMYDNVEKAGYSCAIGYAEWFTDEGFNEIYKAADDKMYLKKREMKAVRGSSSHQSWGETV